VAELKKLAGKDFLLYSGDDETGAEFVLLGGDGVISVTSNIVPDVMHKLMLDALKKDKAAAEALNKPLELLHQRLFLQSNPIPAKWALWRMGKIGAGIRPPLTALEEEFHKPLEEALKAAGAI
jgi:4-hydroxy-tetrahydrodipicolinate synthase